MPILGTVSVQGGIEPMTVTLVGDASVVSAWRAASRVELEQHAAGVPELDIVLVALGPRELLLAWAGGACDVSATLSIHRTTVALAEDPRPACDAVGITKGVVLSYAFAVDPAAIQATLAPAMLLP